MRTHPILLAVAAALLLSVACSRSENTPPGPPPKITTVDAAEPAPESPMPPPGKGVLVGAADAEPAAGADVRGDAEPAQSVEELARHQPKIHAVKVRPEETLQLFSDWSGIPAEDLKLQNGGMQPVYGKKYYVPLSIAELENFEQRRENYWRERTEELYKRYKVLPIKYEVKKSDTLLGIAKKAGTPMWFLVRLNENLDPYHLSVGQVLMVPTLEERKADEPVEEVQTQVGADGETASVLEIIVRPGETAGQYAQWAGIELKDIEKANRHLRNLNNLRVGDRVKLPLSAKQQQRFLERREGRKPKADGKGDAKKKDGEAKKDEAKKDEAKKPAELPKE